MKLQKYKTELKANKECRGLYTCEWKHEIKQSTAEVRYVGPQIPPEIWKEILSFFRWTYDTTKSESQVRLYVNLAEDTWRAWAFKQKARTGMSSQELSLVDLPIEETPEETLARFENWGFPVSGEWIRFGSVHHHCSAGAFQSSTDENNEKGQEGLHLTIGNIDKERHDIHARFYINGDCFDPDMSTFWDVGDVGFSLPLELHDRVARYQMCIRSQVEFPAQWKANLIEIKNTYESNYPAHGFQGKAYSQDPHYMRSDRAMDKIIDTAYFNNYDILDVNEALKSMKEGLVNLIVETCKKEDIDIGHIRWKIGNLIDNPIELQALEEEMEIMKDERDALADKAAGKIDQDQLDPTEAEQAVLEMERTEAPQQHVGAPRALEDKKEEESASDNGDRRDDTPEEWLHWMNR